MLAPRPLNLGCCLVSGGIPTIPQHQSAGRLTKQLQLAWCRYSVLPSPILYTCFAGNLLACTSTNADTKGGTSQSAPFLTDSFQKSDPTYELVLSREIPRFPRPAIEVYATLASSNECTTIQTTHPSRKNNPRSSRSRQGKFRPDDDVLNPAFPPCRGAPCPPPLGSPDPCLWSRKHCLPFEG